MQPRDPSDASSFETIKVPQELYRKLERLSLLHERSVSDLIRHALDIHYSDDAVSARHRLVDRLARLESRLGDEETLHDQIAHDSRIISAERAR